MSAKSKKQASIVRRQFTDDFKREAVQMQFEASGPVASALDARVLQLEAELRRVERERDILKKALAIFSRSE